MKMQKHDRKMHFQSHFDAKTIVTENRFEHGMVLHQFSLFSTFFLSKVPNNFHRRKKAASKRLRRCCRQGLQFQQTKGEPDQLDLRESYLVAWVCHFTSSASQRHVKRNRRRQKRLFLLTCTKMGRFQTCKFFRMNLF